jgi:uncharacterized protein YfkK (UPF0435 family)
MEHNGDFFKQLDELITLFETLQKKATKEGVITKDDPMYKNFELLAGNYNMIKNTIPPELIEEIGNPIKEMIIQMIDQLKKELGIENNTNLVNDDNKNTEQSQLEDIDALLSKGNLSEKEVNDLLDKRSKLNSMLDPEN